MSSARARAEIPELLDFAVHLAGLAGERTLAHFGSVVAHDAKGDGSPVTVADREAEELMRARIGERFPNHSVLGEELGETSPGSRVRWILDPIDGTRTFMRGVPLYGVLVGVEVEGEAVVGVVHHPALGETVAAARGLGCTLNGTPCRVSRVDRIEEALVLTTDVDRIASGPAGEGWGSLQRRCSFSRTWGDCYGHTLVATGRAEAMIDPVVKVWDAAPLLTIAEEAGGRFTTLDGVATIHGASGVSTNGRLHDEVLAALAGGG